MPLSVNAAVALVIERDPFIATALERGIVSYTKLARALNNEVETLCGRGVSTAAIVMALMRHGGKKVEKKKHGARIRARHITTRTGLAMVSVERREIEHVHSLYGKFNMAAGDFLQVSMGNTEISVIYNREKENLVAKTLTKILHRETNLSLLSIGFPDEYLETPGAIEYMIRPIALANVNIIEMVSTYRELNIFFRDKELLKAYATLRSWLNA